MAKAGAHMQRPSWQICCSPHSKLCTQFPPTSMVAQECLDAKQNTGRSYTQSRHMSARDQLAIGYCLAILLRPPNTCMLIKHPEAPQEFNAGYDAQSQDEWMCAVSLVCG